MTEHSFVLFDRNINLIKKKEESWMTDRNKGTLSPPFAVKVSVQISSS